MSRVTKSDQIRAQITKLETEKAALELAHASKLSAIEARISQSKAFLTMFTTTRKKAPAEPKAAASAAGS